MMEPKGRQIHGEAAEARERGESIRALEITERAMEAYQEVGDKVGFAEIQAERFLSLRHLYDRTGDEGYLVLAKHAAMASVELAEKSGLKEAVAVPLFNLAKAQETLGELNEAVENYKRALENLINNPPEAHKDRPAIVADFKIHLATCEYKAGDQAALERALEGLKELEEAEEISDYNKNVWLSGAHMRIAEMLQDQDLAQAKEHLSKAKEIIDSDERLTIRKSQWEKLGKSF